MRPAQDGVVISILGKEFSVACPADERSALEAAAHYLDQRMREIHESGKVMGMDRCAVVAGLNITNELLGLRGDGGGNVGPVMGRRIEALCARIDLVLQNELGKG